MANKETSPRLSSAGLSRHLRLGTIGAVLFGVMTLGSAAWGFAVSGFSWPSFPLNFYIRNNNSDIGAAATNAAITAAFAMWSSVAGVSFVQTFVDPIGGAPPNPTDMSNPANIPNGVLTIEFAAQASYSNLGACAGAPTLGCAFWKGAGSDILGARIEIFDSNGLGDIQWATAPGPAEVDLQTVLAHEIGHSLGMNHSGVASALMFPSYTPGTQIHTLDPDDSAGIISVYGAASSSTPLPATWVLLALAVAQILFRTIKTRPPAAMANASA